MVNDRQSRADRRDGLLTRDGAAYASEARGGKWHDERNLLRGRGAVRAAVESLEKRLLMAVIYVDDTPVTTPTGTAWDGSVRTLQAALQGAQPGDEIRVAGGVYRPRSFSEPFTLLSNLRIVGGYAGHANPSNPNQIDRSLYESILSGDRTGNGLSSDDYGTIVRGSSVTNAELSGLTIRDAVWTTQTNPSFRGAIYLTSSTVLLDTVTVQSNSGVGEGALRVAGGNVTVNNSAFLSNVAAGTTGAAAIGISAGLGTLPVPSFVTVNNTIFTGNSGAAVAVNSGNTLVVSGSTFLQNDSPRNGGAISAVGSNLFVEDTSFVGNRAPGGGAIATSAAGEFSSTRIERSTFFRNAAESSAGGGAVLVSGSSDEYTIIDSAFINNRSANSGGAIMHEIGSSATLSIINSTFTGNAAATSGGAVLGRQGAVVNSIFWENTDAVAAPLTGVTVDRSIVQGGFAGGTAIFDADPLFVTPPTRGSDGIVGTADDSIGDITLRKNSPGVDRGNSAASSSTIDLLGNPRRRDVPSNLNTGTGGSATFIDLGAVETQTVQVDITARISEITEHPAVINFDVVASGSLPFDVPIVLDFSGSGLTIDSDFLAPVSIVLNANQTTASFEIDLLDDNEVELDELLMVAAGSSQFIDPGTKGEVLVLNDDVGGPDLSVTFAGSTLPPLIEVFPLQPFAAPDVQIVNKDPLASVSGTVTFYLSIDEVAGSDDVVVGSFPTGTLDASGQLLIDLDGTNGPLMLSAPADAALQTYPHLIAVVTVDGGVTDVLPADNVAVSGMSTRLVSVNLTGAFLENGAPVSVVPGQSVTVPRFQLFNLGQGTSTAQTVELFLSTTPVLDGSEISVGVVPLSFTIESGGSTDEIVGSDVVVPENTPPGQYFIVARVTPGPGEFESPGDQGDNTIRSPSPFIQVRQEADLSIAFAVEPPGGLVTGGQQVSLGGLTISNAGPNAVDVGLVDVFLSVDNALDLSDTLVFSTSGGPLIAGGSITLSDLSFSLTTQFVAGTYRLFARVTPLDDTPDPVEANNVAAAGASLEIGVDLSVAVNNSANAVLPREVASSQTLDIRVSSVGASAQGFTHSIYLSTNDVFDGADLLVSGPNNSNITVAHDGSVTIGGVPYTVPAELAAGVYRVLVVVAPATATEVNPSNNVALGGLLTLLPDYRPSIVSVSGAGGTFPPGGTIPLLSTVVRNDGIDGGEFGVRVVLSSDSTFDAADRVLRTTSVALGAQSGDQAFVFNNLGLPADLASGTYRLYVQLVAPGQAFPNALDVEDASAPINIVKPADLALAFGAPRGVVKAFPSVQSFSAPDLTITNLGDVASTPSRVTVVLSTDGAFGVGDFVVGVFDIAAIAPGGSTTLDLDNAASLSLVAPADAFLGTYNNLIARIDSVPPGTPDFSAANDLAVSASPTVLVAVDLSGAFVGNPQPEILIAGGTISPLSLHSFQQR